MNDEYMNIENEYTHFDQLIDIIKNYPERPSWDDYFVMNCFLISKRSPCNRLHVGCVVVKDNRIVTTGYNGFMSGTSHVGYVRDNHEQFTIHAEVNAVTDAVKRGISLQDS